MCDSRPKTKYIYDLPYCEREDLCRILDLHEKWKTLGGLMKFSTLDIQCMEHLERRGKSPSDELLTKWSLQNHTVQELFVLLSRMNHFQAMSILKPFVDPQYHQLMFEGEESWTKLLMDSNNCTGGQAHHPQGKKLMTNGPSAAAAANNMTDVGHNLNVMLPETQKINKPGFSEKIQNIGNPISLEENGRQPYAESLTPQTPGTACSPPVLTPNAGSRYGGVGQPQLSPVGIAALSNIPLGQHHFDLRATSFPQRKLSDGSMVTIPSEYQNVLPMHDYKELEAATNGWNPANIIGRGGFGTVFKGVWKNTDVAIKRIELPKGDSRESQEVQFQQSHRELQVLQRIHHENILQLYSFSFNGNQPCLVYQFMEKGSLEDRLQCRNRSSPLTWPQRYNIAKGAARGLQYLHTVQEKPLIHGDIKSANILLDANFEPRIGDFGLAREGPQTHYTHMKVSRVHGTRPYLPDEFLRSKKLSTKVDTYSFGVVLFELATGLRAFDDKRVNKYLKDEVTNHKDVLQLIDPKIVKAPIIFSHFIDLGKVCVRKLPKDRPEMKVVCQDLDQLASNAAQVTPRELQEYYDKLYELRRQSISNSPQPVSAVSGQPPNSYSRHPANSSSHPQMGPPISGQPSLGISVNAPTIGGTQGVGSVDVSGNGQAGPSGHAGNNIITSRPSIQHASPQQPLPIELNIIPKPTDGVSLMTAGTGSVEPMLPTVLPTVLPVTRNSPLLSPVISVMPPTGSEASMASTRYSMSDSSDCATEDLQPASSIMPEEINTPSEEQGPENLPLLSVLGIRDDDPISETSNSEQPVNSFKSS